MMFRRRSIPAISSSATSPPLSPARGGHYLAATAKRPGEDRFFFGAFGVFRCICAIFRAFCLVVMRKFVYLQTTKGVENISYPVPINANEL